MKQLRSVFILCFVLFFTGYVKSQCPVFQNGAVGNDQANRTVVFYDLNGDTVAICGCQLTGNELKCHTCKPAEADYYYYEIFINGALVICYSAVTLGVELKDYSATFEGAMVTCNWTTVSEQNNSHFYWQKSPDGKVTWNLEEINGAGTTSEINRYSIQDFDPMREWAYYRLIQVDFDGKETKYPWIYVYKDELKTSSLRLLPNPTRGEFSFLLPFDWTTAEVTVINIAGLQVFQKTVKFNQEPLQTNLMPGRYTVQVKTSHGCAYSTLIVY